MVFDILLIELVVWMHIYDGLQLIMVVSGVLMFAEYEVKKLGNWPWDWGGSSHETVYHRLRLLSDEELIWTDADCLWNNLTDHEDCHHRNQDGVGRRDDFVQEDGQCLQGASIAEKKSHEEPVMLAK